MWHAGHPLEALEDAMAGAQIQATDVNSLELAAVSLHTLGRFHEALEWCVPLSPNAPAPLCGRVATWPTRDPRLTGAFNPR
jgi:hypothetical protein